jgi:hypothetical protein
LNLTPRSATVLALLGDDPAALVDAPTLLAAAHEAVVVTLIDEPIAALGHQATVVLHPALQQVATTTHTEVEDVVHPAATKTKVQAESRWLPAYAKTHSKTAVSMSAT